MCETYLCKLISASIFNMYFLCIRSLCMYMQKYLYIRSCYLYSYDHRMYEYLLVYSMYVCIRHVYVYVRKSLTVCGVHNYARTYVCNLMTSFELHCA